jgi:hypothetical protein
MATLDGTIVSVSNVTCPAGSVFDTSKNQVYTAFIGFTITGTYVQNDNAQILTVPAAMEALLKWGRSITLLDAMFAAPGDENGTPIGMKTVAVSSTTITFELTGGDLTTEHTAAALATVGRPIFVAVTFTAPQM